MRSDEEIYEAARAKCTQTKRPPFPWKIMREGREIIKAVIAEVRAEATAEVEELRPQLEGATELAFCDHERVCVNCNARTSFSPVGTPESLPRTCPSCRFPLVPITYKTIADELRTLREVEADHAAAIEQAEREMLEMACGKICPRCAIGLAAYDPNDTVDYWSHRTPYPSVCAASAIRRAYVERVAKRNA